MKKAVGIIVKVLSGIIILILVLVFTVPVLFKRQIRTKVEQTINSSVNASVKFEDYRLGFFRNFPNLTFSLKNLSVVGIDRFKNDTLAGFRSIDLVFNLSSLFKKSGYEVKYILMDHATINVIYLKDSKVNYDIVKDTTTTAKKESASSPGVKVLLKKVSMLNSSIAYIDESSDLKVYLADVNATLAGDMTSRETDLRISFKSGAFTYIMGGMKYLDKAVLDSKIDVLADLDKWKFTFRENYLSLNDLRVNFSGTVGMPGKDITTDIKFQSEKSSFKSLLSLIPAVYMKDYKDLKTSGDFSFSGVAKGTYSDADSTLPDVTLAISVSNGLISYPSLPEQIKNINVKADLFVDGKVMDRTIVGIDKFHMEVAGNPFDMTFALKTPVSDPDFQGSMVGKIDLGALSKAMPMNGISLSGIIDMSFQMAGRMSLLEAKKYESFKASGTMNIKNMLVAMTGYPELKINEADLNFTPAYAAMSNTSLNVGSRSDFALNGRIENYIPWLFSNKTIKGTLSMRSRLTDVSDIMSKMTAKPEANKEVKKESDKITDSAPGTSVGTSAGTAAVKDTTSLSPVRVPRNIDFDFDAIIDQLTYDKIRTQNLKGHIIVRDGILSIRAAGMDILNGKILMNGDYDTRDSLKPVLKSDFDIQGIAVKDAFTTFNSVQKLAPTAKGISGIVNARLSYTSLLGKDMMPVLSSINGSGKLQSDEITLLESVTFDKMKEILKLGEKYNNTFKDVNISFKISDGRIYVTPFNVKTGNLKMNISGDQGLDQTLNYIVKTEIPRSDLGSSVNNFIDNLSTQAAAFGIVFKPAEVLKVNVKVSGTFTKPVVSPFFGKTPDENTGGNSSSVKENVKQVIDNTADQAREKARAEAEAEGARLVKEAEVKGQQLRDEAAKVAEAIRKEADTQAQNLIKGAESKNELAKMAARRGAESLRKNAGKQADQVIKEADIQANKLVEEAKAKSDELIKKI